MNYLFRIPQLSLLIVLFVVGNLKGQQTGGKLIPSEALALMIHSVDTKPQIKRIDATKLYLPRVIKEDLSRAEQFYLGEIYFWNFMPKEAIGIYTKFMDGKDDISRAAWQRVMQINFRAFEKHDEVENQIVTFREKFKPLPFDRAYASDQVINLSTKYAKEGEHQKVVDLIDQELKSLNYKGPYKSFMLPASFFESYRKLGREEYALNLLNQAKQSLNDELIERIKNAPDKDVDYQIPSSRVSGMQTLVTERLGYAQVNTKFQELIALLEQAIRHFKA